MVGSVRHGGRRAPTTILRRCRSDAALDDGDVVSAVGTDRSAKEDAYFVKHLPFGFVNRHRKAFYDRERPPDANEVYLALGGSELMTRGTKAVTPA